MIARKRGRKGNCESCDKAWNMQQVSKWCASRCLCPWTVGPAQIAPSKTRTSRLCLPVGVIFQGGDFIHGLTDHKRTSPRPGSSHKSLLGQLTHHKAARVQNQIALSSNNVDFNRAQAYQGVGIRRANPPKVAIILRELGTPHEIVAYPFSDVKTPEFLAINPDGRLPAIHDPNTDTTLWESGAILLYLVDKYDPDHKTSFAPQTTEAYHAQQWLFYQVQRTGSVLRAGVLVQEVPPRETAQCGRTIRQRSEARHCRALRPARRKHSARQPLQSRVAGGCWEQILVRRLGVGSVASWSSQGIYSRRRVQSHQ